MKGVSSFEDLSDLLLFIPALDRAYLKEWHEKMEAKSKNKNKPGKR